MHEFHKILKILTEADNYIFLAFIFFLLFLSAVFYFYKYIILPRERSHIEEKKKLMAMFAELNPEPLIRFNIEGKIVISNSAAAELFNLNGGVVQELFTDHKFDPLKIIETDEELTFVEKIGNRSYHVLVKPVKNLSIGQIYFNDITERVNTELQLKNYQLKLREFNKSLQIEIEEERSRIAGDLHDSVGQKLLLFKLQLQKYLPAEIFSSDSDLKTSFDDTINELRNIIYVLKPKILDEVGLFLALNSLCGKISNSTGIVGVFEFEGSEDKLPKKMELIIYRIVQEAVNNIVKHSNCTNFSIKLVNKEQIIRLLIQDNGVGFDNEILEADLTGKKGFGLFHLKEKIESFDGFFVVESVINEGTTLFIELNKEVFNE